MYGVFKFEYVVEMLKKIILSKIYIWTKNWFFINFNYVCVFK